MTPMQVAKLSFFGSGPNQRAFGKASLLILFVAHRIVGYGSHQSTYIRQMPTDAG
jgi:hypothetical protein